MSSAAGVAAAASHSAARAWRLSWPRCRKRSSACSSPSERMAAARSFLTTSSLALAGTLVLTEEQKVSSSRLRSSAAPSAKRKAARSGSEASSGAAPGSVVASLPSTSAAVAAKLGPPAASSRPGSSSSAASLAKRSPTCFRSSVPSPSTAKGSAAARAATKRAATAAAASSSSARCGATPRATATQSATRRGDGGAAASTRSAAARRAPMGPPRTSHSCASESSESRGSPCSLASAAAAAERPESGGPSTASRVEAGSAGVVTRAAAGDAMNLVELAEEERGEERRAGRQPALAQADGAHVAEARVENGRRRRCAVACRGGKRERRVAQRLELLIEGQLLGLLGQRHRHRRHERRGVAEGEQRRLEQRRRGQGGLQRRGARQKTHSVLEDAQRPRWRRRPHEQLLGHGRHGGGLLALGGWRRRRVVGARPQLTRGRLSVGGGSDRVEARCGAARRELRRREVERERVAWCLAQRGAARGRGVEAGHDRALDGDRRGGEHGSKGLRGRRLRRHAAAAQGRAQRLAERPARGDGGLQRELRADGDQAELGGEGGGERRGSHGRAGEPDEGPAGREDRAVRLERRARLDDGGEGNQRGLDGGHVGLRVG
eukprot:scaffold123388_cov48-Phaeocystis_antarctica.AAC.2